VAGFVLVPSLRPRFNSSSLPHFGSAFYPLLLGVGGDMDNYFSCPCLLQYIFYYMKTRLYDLSSGFLNACEGNLVYELLFNLFTSCV
jgi:hypothetical protein